MEQKTNLKNKAVMWAAVGCVLAVATVTSIKPAKAADSPQPGEKPNIVLINMDNFGYGELGCYGGGVFPGGGPPRPRQLGPAGGGRVKF